MDSNKSAGINLGKPGMSPQPMTVGNIVSATISLYRTRFGDYFALAGQSVLWVLPPLVLLAISVGIIIAGSGGLVATGAAGSSNNNLLGVGVLVFVVTFVVGIYCFTRSMVCQAAMSRLAFLELCQMTETPKESHRFVRRRMWKFLYAAILFIFLILAVYLATSIVMGVVVGVVVGAGASAASSGNPLITGLVSIVAILFVLLFLFWMLARFFVYDTSLAIEEKIAAAETFGLSWRLTKGNAFRVLAVMTITFLVSLPLFLLIQIVAAIAQPILAQILPGGLGDVLAFLVGVGIGLVGNLALLPLWQIVKSVIYYDLKSRKEGIDLQLLDT